MEDMDYWRLCDELSVIQASFLMIDYDPSGCENLDNWSQLPRGYEACFTALKNAVNSGTLPAVIRKNAKDEMNFATQSKILTTYFDPPIDWHLTTIKVLDLKVFLKDRGVKTGFFFPQSSDDRDYLDENNPNYAPKLAAAIHAWEAVRSDVSRLRGKTPKQALSKFLRENAAHYGLTKDDGNPNESGIEEICKVANWKPEGGAAKTPTTNGTHPMVADNPTTPKQLQKNKGLVSSPTISQAEHDEIPF